MKWASIISDHWIGVLCFLDIWEVAFGVWSWLSSSWILCFLVFWTQWWKWIWLIPQFEVDFLHIGERIDSLRPNFSIFSMKSFVWYFGFGIFVQTLVYICITKRKNDLLVTSYGRFTLVQIVWSVLVWTASNLFGFIFFVVWPVFGNSSWLRFWLTYFSISTIRLCSDLVQLNFLQFSLAFHLANLCTWEDDLFGFNLVFQQVDNSSWVNCS